MLSQSAQTFLPRYVSGAQQAAQRAFGRANEEVHSARARARASGRSRRGEGVPSRRRKAQAKPPPLPPSLVVFSLAQVEREAAGALDTRPRDERDEADLSAENDYLIGLVEGAVAAGEAAAAPWRLAGARLARRLTLIALGVGAGAAGLGALAATQGLRLFTRDAAVRAAARPLAAPLALATLLHGAVCAGEGVLLARRDLGFLAFV